MKNPRPKWTRVYHALAGRVIRAGSSYDPGRSTARSVLFFDGYVRGRRFFLLFFQ